ncbi:MAG: hypothetical protein SNG38_07270 [Rikenellaceae bacterium]
MIVYKFRMLSDENDHFVRDYQVPATLTLLEFHNFIIETLEYEPCITSFFTADAQWEKTGEFTAVDMGFEQEEGDESISAPRPMEGVALCEILHYMHDRLIYNFDIFASRAYYLELIEANEVDDADSKLYPRESFAHATAPDQYDPDSSVEDSSIFDEMMGDFGDFDGDDNYDDSY